MRKMFVGIACLLALVVSAPNAMATSLSVGDSYYLGRVFDGNPASASDEIFYINTLITLAPGATAVQIPAATGEFYDRVGSTLAGSLPTAVLAGAFKDDTTPPYDNISVTGYTYILAKYDADKAGSYVWYIPGQTTVDIPSALGSCGNPNDPTKQEGCGLSHYSLYNVSQVPDGGATLMLLGGALVGLSALRRKFRA